MSHPLEFGSKEQCYKEAEEKIQFLEAEIERRVNDDVRNYVPLIVIAHDPKSFDNWDDNVVVLK